MIYANQLHPSTSRALTPEALAETTRSAGCMAKSLANIYAKVFVFVAQWAADNHVGWDQAKQQIVDAAAPGQRADVAAAIDAAWRAARAAPRYVHPGQGGR